MNTPAHKAKMDRKKARNATMQPGYFDRDLKKWVASPTRFPPSKNDSPEYRKAV